MAAAWREPATGEAYFDELLVDAEVAGADFLREVLTESKELRRYDAHVQKKMVLGTARREVEMMSTATFTTLWSRLRPDGSRRKCATQFCQT
jgi:hypothetical protein